MTDKIIEVEAITMLGQTQRFRCIDIVAIDGKPFDEYCGERKASDIEELRDAIIHLNGRIDEISTMAQNFAYRNELHKQVEQINKQLSLRSK